MKYGIVIPCYNEAKRLKFEEFQQFIDTDTNVHLCFVNDGSRDNTLELLYDFQKEQEERVSVYDMPKNCGKAEAVRSGINYLNTHHRFDNMGFMDADLSTSFEEYGNLVSQLRSSAEHVQMVFGSRKGEESGEIDRSFFRKAMSSMVGGMIRLLLQLPIKDTQCGAKVFSSEAVQYCFNRPFVSRWLFDVEIFIRMKNRYSRKYVMHKLMEIPLKKWVAVGDSKVTMQESMKIPAQLAKIASTYYLFPQWNGAVRAASFLFFSVLPFLKP